MTATLTEISRLSWTRPSPYAPAASVAAWYEHKAELLSALAAELPHAEQLAEQAHAHAVQLLGQTTSAGSAARFGEGGDRR